MSKINLKLNVVGLVVRGKKKLRQEDCNLEGSLSNLVRPHC